MYICVYICIYVCICVCMYVCLYVCICICMYMYVCLTNRFQVAVRLFSNRLQMKSKCGKNKNSGTRGVAECLTNLIKLI